MTTEDGSLKTLARFPIFAELNYSAVLLIFKEWIAALYVANSLTLRATTVSAIRTEMD